MTPTHPRPTPAPARPSAVPEPGERVRSAALPRPGGGHLALRHLGREATVLVRLHDAECTACREHVRALDAATDRFRDWYARLVTVVPGSVEDAREVAEEVEQGLVAVVADPDGDGPLAAADGPAALVFDRYGEVYHAEAVRDHAFPDAGAVESWLVYLATQCPECGVPDRP